MYGVTFENVPNYIKILFHNVVEDMKQANVDFDVNSLRIFKMCHAKTYTGICYRISKNNNVYYRIDISKYMTVKEDIKSTIAHELIHTKHWNHDENFRKEIDKLHKYDNSYLRFYGCGKGDDDNVTFEHKYTITCKHCGHQYQYERKRKFFNNLNRCSCSLCKSKELEIKQNY